MKDWLLRGASVARGPTVTEPRDVAIRSGRLSEHPDTAAKTLDLGGCVLFPGLTNAHDHLEFALFPRLGQGPYQNARQWAEDIYRPAESPVAEHLLVPKRDRLVWGGLRNLLCGVTNVCHHNPYQPRIFENGFPVNVLRRYGWAHSFAFETSIAERFGQSAPDAPFFVHLGEGVDAAAAREIFELDAMGALCRRTVLIHALGLDVDGWDLVRRRDAAVVACPSANRFLFGRTLPLDVIQTEKRILLGSDSPLTAAGDLIDEMETLDAAPDLLYELAIERPHRILRLAPADRADLVVCEGPAARPAEALRRRTQLALVFVRGELRLAADAFARQRGISLTGLQPLQYGEQRYWVAADITGLLQRARAILGDDIRLGGKPVAQ